MTITARVAGIFLASMLLMGIALAGNASATTLLWLVCLKGVGLTKYTNEKCLEANSGGSWQSVGVPKGAEITVKLSAISILLTDTETVVGKVVVSCANAGSRGLGVIKANGEGEIRVAEYENPQANCTDEEKNCPEVTKLKGANLPWKTKIFVGTNGEPLTKIEPGNTEKKEPGWEVTCKAVVNVTDKCTSPPKEEEQARLANFRSTTELLVIALFEGKVKAECSQSGKKTGEVKGSIAILLPGGSLSIITSP